MESEHARYSQNRGSSQQYRNENIRNYQQNPRTLRRNQTNDSYNDRLNTIEDRQIPGKSTNSEIVNELTDRYMNANFPPQQPISPDKANLMYAEHRCQHIEKDPRSLQQPRQQPTKKDSCNQNKNMENLKELTAPRPFRQSTCIPNNEFKPLAGQRLAYSTILRSEAARELAAGDAANLQQTENEQNAYQPYTSSGLAVNPKLKESQGVPSYQMTSKDSINVYDEDCNVEQITALNVEEITGGFTDLKVLQTGQRRHSKIIEEAIQLEKTKSIVVELIDNALDKLKSKRTQGKESETSFTASENSIPASRLKQMKDSCFKKIEVELKLLKTLDRFSNESE